MVSLRGQQISKAAQQVLGMINGIKSESDKFNKVLDTLANHVKNTSNTMSTAVDNYAKLKSQIANASNLELEAESAVANAVADKKVESLPQNNTDKLL